MNKISGFVDGVMGGLASFFQTASPSKRVRDEIGVHIPSGLGVGIEQNEDAALRPLQRLNEHVLAEALRLNTTLSFDNQSTLTQRMIPLQATGQQPGPVVVEATLDPATLSSAMAAAFPSSDAGAEQAAVKLDKSSITTLASAIVDAVRIQSRQGVVSLG